MKLQLVLGGAATPSPARAAAAEKAAAAMVVLLRKFLDGPQPNTWLRTKNFALYVRKGHRLIPPDPTGFVTKPVVAECLDLANIEVAPKLQNHKVFSQFLVQAQAVCPYPYVVIENVHNPHLFAHLVRQPSWFRGVRAADPTFFWRNPKVTIDRVENAPP